MEHLTSTQIIEPGALAEEGIYEATLGTVSHEFFHVWNVKRLRPLELGPWDFTRPLNTRGLWVAEGFTNYYGHLMLRRAGIWNDKRVSGSTGTDRQAHRECAGKPVDERGRVVAVSSVYRRCASRAGS